MGWFTRKSRASEADKSLARLQEQVTDLLEPRINVTILDTPASTHPGTPLYCYNEDFPVEVGAAVQVCGSTFVQQAGTILAMSRDGVPIEVLESGEVAEVVLDDGVDLTQVFRGGSLYDPWTTFDRPPGFTMQVHRAEPRGTDALVVGRVAQGAIEVGEQVVASHGADEAHESHRVLAVEPMGTELGVVIQGRPAECYQYGDEVSRA